MSRPRITITIDPRRLDLHDGESVAEDDLRDTLADAVRTALETIGFLDKHSDPDISVDVEWTFWKE